MKYKLVLIEWLDSFGCSSEWATVKENVSPSVLRCQSVGWLVYDGEDCKAVIPHLTQEGHGDVKQQGCGDMTIPTTAIVSVSELRLPKKLSKAVR